MAYVVGVAVATGPVVRVAVVPVVKVPSAERPVVGVAVVPVVGVGVTVGLVVGVAVEPVVAVAGLWISDEEGVGGTTSLCSFASSCSPSATRSSKEASFRSAANTSNDLPSFSPETTFELSPMLRSWRLSTE